MSKDDKRDPLVHWFKNNRIEGIWSPTLISDKDKEIKSVIDNKGYAHTCILSRVT